MILFRRDLQDKSTFSKSNFTIKLMRDFVATKVIKESENQILFEIEQSDDLEHRDLKEIRMSSENKKIYHHCY